MPRHRAETIDRSAVRESIRGLALGDAFGETWFFRPPGELVRDLAGRRLKQGPWPWTDDTAMALGLLAVLDLHGEVDQDALAHRFAEVYRADPYRNYGPSMHDVLAAVGAGEGWAEVTARQFDGQGSWGNGAAMRVAPLGVWFADDLTEVVAQATRQALVTHAHPEAAAGAVAVAVAAALSARGISPTELIAVVAEHTPSGLVADGLRRAAELPSTVGPEQAAAILGSGHRISAPDTVPYALWCAARCLDDLVEALWTTVAGGGDIDTTCAIVGGVVAGRTGLSGVPAEWLAACEPLPEWV